MTGFIIYALFVLVCTHIASFYAGAVIGRDFEKSKRKWDD